MRILTNEQMQAVDRETIDRVCPGLELMERAGRGVAEVIVHGYGEEAGRAVVFAGPGNNGGDGLVIARYLSEAGWHCAVHLFKDPDKFKGDPAKNYQRLRELMDTGATVVERHASHPDWPAHVQEDLADADIVVDAIFGTGISGSPRGKALDMIRAINESGVPVVAVDIPSGVNGTTGDTPGEAVMAAETLTIGAPKMGTVFHPGRWHCGEVSVIDIGFPDEIIDKHAGNVHLLDAFEAAARLPFRPPDIHKFDAGTLVVVAGSEQYRGAALLAAEAALRSGAGMVYLGVPETIREAIDVALREVITIPLPVTRGGTIAPGALEELRPYMQRADAFAVGPGMGRDDATDEFIRTIVRKSDIPTVVDADGITALAGHADLLHSLDHPVVLTPHSGELARLIDADVPEEPTRRVALTAEVATRLGLTLVHKGAPTLIASVENGVWVNTTGDSALATGGTGDVLTGLIAGVLAQGAEPTDAACVAVYLHGKAGETASREMGKRGVIAGDLLWALGEPLARLEALVDD